MAFEVSPGKAVEETQEESPTRTIEFDKIMSRIDEFT
jgi:hypothetical protein